MSIINTNSLATIKFAKSQITATHDNLASLRTLSQPEKVVNSKAANKSDFIEAYLVHMHTHLLV